jgi:hypothetical protein
VIGEQDSPRVHAGLADPRPRACRSRAKHSIPARRARKHADVVLLAPAGGLAQVERVRLAGEAGVAGQEPSQGEPLGWVNTGSTAATAVDVDVVAMGHLRVRLRRTKARWAAVAPATMLHLTVKTAG